jgi:RimJ/RimL family protein N-acetyltransferase
MPALEFLHDDRVALIPLEDEHLPTLVRWINDQAVLTYLGMLGGLSLGQEREWLQKVRASQSERVFGILLRGSERLIGTLALHGVLSHARSAEYGISIGEKDCWSQGYGTEAGRLLLDWGFNRLGLHSIYLRVHDNNPRGSASYGKLGFRAAGRLREHVYRDGQYWDIHYMDLLRSEFNEKWADWRAAQAARYGLGK